MSMEPPAPPPPPPAPPPPPSSGGPSAGGSNAGALNIGDAVSYGWDVYWKNVGTLIVISLVVIAIQVVFGVLGDAVDNLFGRFVIQLVGWLLAMLVSLGWLRVSLEITRGVKPEVGDLFRAQGYGPYLLASILFGIGFYVGLILLIVPGIIFACVFGFYGFVIAERGDGVGVLESLQRSADITRGNRWQLFGLGVVLLLINFVGALLLLIGLIFTLGISVLAWAYAYRTLSGETVERSAWT
jgi:uncharacterized membrane protein